jgi:hypothetical protein
MRGFGSPFVRVVVPWAPAASSRSSSSERDEEAMADGASKQKIRIRLKAYDHEIIE